MLRGRAIKYLDNSPAFVCFGASPAQHFVIWCSARPLAFSELSNLYRVINFNMIIARWTRSCVVFAYGCRRSLYTISICLFVSRVVIILKGIGPFEHHSAWRTCVSMSHEYKKMDSHKYRVVTLHVAQKQQLMSVTQTAICFFVVDPPSATHRPMNQKHYDRIFVPLMLMALSSVPAERPNGIEIPRRISFRSPAHTYRWRCIDSGRSN